MEKVMVVHGSQEINEDRAIGAALFFDQERRKVGGVPPEVIVFSGGKTKGENMPSEAQEMQGIFVQKIEELLGVNKRELSFKDFPSDFSILTIGEGKSVCLSLEEGSCDTLDNARNSLELIRSKKAQVSLILFSSFSHLPRVRKAWRDAGFDGETELRSLEASYYQAGGDYKDKLWKNLKSPKFIFKNLLEIPKYLLVHIPFSQKLIRMITEKRIKK